MRHGKQGILGGTSWRLSIAVWIVHAHQGRIEIDSELNKGSTFAFYLPIQKN
jgi:two-component system sensor histidine kinase ResE